MKIEEDGSVVTTLEVVGGRDWVGVRREAWGLGIV